MTKAEKIIRMAECKAEAEKYAIEYNEANDYMTLEAKGEAPADAQKPRRLVEITEDIERVVKEHNDLSRAVFYETCLEQENPMLDAIKRLSYGVISAKDEKPDQDAAFTVRVIKDGSKLVDLLAFNSKHQIGADKKWPHTAQKLNCLLTADRAKGLGISGEKLKLINSSLQMSATAKDIEMGKNPTSSKNLLANLQTVIDQMLGEGYTVTESDVNFLRFTYSSAGKKALAVKCSNHKGFVQLVSRMCHRIVTDGEYEIESKEIKLTT